MDSLGIRMNKESFGGGRGEVELPKELKESKSQKIGKYKGNKG